MTEKIQRLKKIISDSDNIVFFGGAGVSVPSGIPDFRSSNGLYSTPYGGLPAEQILHIRFFNSYPEIFYSFYREKILHPEAKPNDAHIALAKLESERKLRALITQNIDSLHSRAGSDNIISLHGTASENYCTVCAEEYDENYIINSQGVPRCRLCNGIIRPRVTLYGEALNAYAIRSAVAAITSADCLIVAGTSLTVNPAAGLVDLFDGNHLVIVNMSETKKDREATLVIHEDIAEVFKRTILM